MRKFVFLLALFVGIVISQTSMLSEAEAADYYVGTSNTTGRDCYLMTGTFNEIDYRSFKCTIKMVRPSDDDVQYLEYYFWRAPRERIFHFQNSQGYSGLATREDTPIEYNITIYYYNNAQLGRGGL